MDKLAKVRAEVEKLNAKLLRGACSSQIAMETMCKEEAYNEILAILDTMQEESKQCMYSRDNYTEEDRKVLCEGCEEKCEFNQVKESAILQHKEETCKENGNSLTQEPVSEELKTELNKYIKDHFTIDTEQLDRFGVEEKDYMYSMDKSDMLALVEHFTKWQKTKDESTTEDLGEYINELSKQFPEVSFAKLSRIAVRVAKWQKEKEYTCYEEAFEDGAKWKVENLWKPADGDDLPIFDREVVVLIKYDAQLNIHDKEYSTYRVGFGHRPNPDGWDGKNIDTNEVTHYTPKLYDKGGWNAPDIVYWLDYNINELLCREK